jgi:protein-tyrosine-phosphatase
VARQTALSLLTGRERSDFLTLDDPAPGVAELAQLGREVRRAARLRARIAHARLSAGRRRRMRARAGSALHESSTLLFVCAGNIGRSPFAAAMAERTLGNGRVVRSAGFGRAGRRPTPDAVGAAARFDVDLAGHRSHTVSAALVRESEAIFVFDYGNLSHLARRFPDAAGKVHLLGTLDPTGPLFIADPWGAGAEVYAATYHRIAAALAAG